MIRCPHLPLAGRTPLGLSCQAGVAIEQVNQFKHAWMRHAFRYTKEYNSIFAGQLVDFLKELPPPLGVGAEGSYLDCQVLAKKVGKPITTARIGPSDDRELLDQICRCANRRTLRAQR